MYQSSYCCSYIHTNANRKKMDTFASILLLTVFLLLFPSQNRLLSQHETEVTSTIHFTFVMCESERILKITSERILKKFRCLSIRNVVTEAEQAIMFWRTSIFISSTIKQIKLQLVSFKSCWLKTAHIKPFYFYCVNMFPVETGILDETFWMDHPCFLITAMIYYLLVAVMWYEGAGHSLSREHLIGQKSL